MSFLNQIRKLILHAGMLTILFSSSFAATYYVDINNPVADDSNPGTSDLPWKTIRKANHVVVAGDTVVVRAGVYHEWICPDTTGYPGKWITYRSEPTHGAILNGWCELDSVVVEGDRWQHVSPDTGNIWYRKLITSFFTEAWMDSVRLGYPFPYACDTLKFEPGRSYIDSTKTLYVWLEDGDSPFNHRWHVTIKTGVLLFPVNKKPREYIRVEGFVVERFGEAGILASSNYLQIRNNISQYNGRAGIAVTFCDHVLVEDNEARYNCTGIGWSQGIAAYGVFGKDIVFRRNISHDNFDGDDPTLCGTDGNGYLFDTSPPYAGATFINNIAYNNQGAGFGVNRGSNVIIINNTSFNNSLKNSSGGECFIAATSEYASNHILIRNNIFAGGRGNRKSLQMTYSYSKPPVDIKLDHNLYYRHGADSTTKLFDITFRTAQGNKYRSMNLTEFQAFSDSLNEFFFDPHWGIGSMVAHPQLQDWQVGDFRLLKTSPAIDAGTSEAAPEKDFYGTIRPQGDGFDMGAYEYKSTSGVHYPPSTPIIKFTSYPNPFNNCAKIRYQLTRPAKIKLTVYDILGRKVSEIVHNRQQAGIHEFIWDGKNSAGNKLSSGVYLIRLVSEYSEEIIKTLLLK